MVRNYQQLGYLCLCTKNRKLDKRMLFVSVCLIFALARVETKERQGTATFTGCKGRALLGYRVHGLGAKLWNKGQCDHARIKGLTFLTMVEVTNCHKNQRHVKREVLCYQMIFPCFMSLYHFSEKKRSFFRNWNANIPEKQCPWGKNQPFLRCQTV